MILKFIRKNKNNQITKETKDQDQEVDSCKCFVSRETGQGNRIESPAKTQMDAHGSVSHAVTELAVQVSRESGCVNKWCS